MIGRTAAVRWDLALPKYIPFFFGHIFRVLSYNYIKIRPQNYAILLEKIAKYIVLRQEPQMLCKRSVNIW